MLWTAICQNIAAWQVPAWLGSPTGNSVNYSARRPVSTAPERHVSKAAAGGLTSSSVIPTGPVPPSMAIGRGLRGYETEFRKPRGGLRPSRVQQCSVQRGTGMVFKHSRRESTATRTDRSWAPYPLCATVEPKWRLPSGDTNLGFTGGKSYMSDAHVLRAGMFLCSDLYALRTPV